MGMVLDSSPRYGGSRQKNNKKQQHTVNNTGKSMRKLIALSLIAMLAGCATVDGVGRDISGAARGVQSWF